MIECKGCCIQNVCKYTIESKTCPCIMCIVKMVCVKACQERSNFRIRVSIKRRGNT